MNTESASLVSGRNYTSGLRDQKEFGLSNVKIFNHKLSKDEVEKLHTADTQRKYNIFNIGRPIMQYTENPE